jgi:hypothetical protein
VEPSTLTGGCHFAGYLAHAAFSRDDLSLADNQLSRVASTKIGTRFRFHQFPEIFWPGTKQ